MRIIPLVILLLGVAFLTDAQAPRKRGNAKEVFDRATVLYRAGDYKGAAGGYRQAYDIEPNTTTLLMAAKAYYRDQGIVCVSWQDAAYLRLRAIEDIRIFDEWLGAPIPGDPIPANPFDEP